MPFVKRRIEPLKIRKNEKQKEQPYDCHDDVVNNSLVKVLKQLSSLTNHAEDIFREIHEQSVEVFNRCCRVSGRIQTLHATVRVLNPKEVQIPVSNLEEEQKIPVYLHYHSSDSVEEDLFVTDTRTPCLIHLHKMAGNDWNGMLKGSQAFAKPSRPKSFDPNLLMQDPRSPGRYNCSKSTTNIIASPELNDLYNPKSILPTPKQKMAEDSSQHVGEVVHIDTSGCQFDRKVNLRRSQRSSVGLVRRKSQQKFRDRHKTLMGLPGCISHELGVNPPRPSSLHSDVNSVSSFVGDSSVASDASTPREVQNAEIQTDEVKIVPASPVKRRMKNKNSKSDIPKRGAHVSLPNIDDLDNYQVSDDLLNTEEYTSKPITVRESNHVIGKAGKSLKGGDFGGDKNVVGDDRISSGFWSGTESARHSTTSEILLQHQNVTHALQQVLKTNGPYNSLSRNHEPAPPMSASTSSLNSRLSTFENSPGSSLLSLSHQQHPGRSSTPDDSSFLPRSELGTPHKLTFSTPAGAYGFMNHDFVEERREIKRPQSPMDLLVLGNRRGRDGLIRDELTSLDDSIYSQDQDGYYSSMHDSSGLRRRQTAPAGPRYVPAPNTPDVFTPGVPTVPQHLMSPQVYNVHAVQSSTPKQPPQEEKRFFGNDFSDDFGASPRSQSSATPSSGELQTELRQKLLRRSQSASPTKPKRTSSKPTPPRRDSSLRSPRMGPKEVLAYMEPLNTLTKKALHGDVPDSAPSTKLETTADVHSLQSSPKSPESENSFRYSRSPTNTIAKMVVQNGFSEEIGVKTPSPDKTSLQENQAPLPSPQSPTKEPIEQKKRTQSVYQVKTRSTSPSEPAKRPSSMRERSRSPLSLSNQQNLVLSPNDHVVKKPPVAKKPIRKMSARTTNLDRLSTSEPLSPGVGLPTSVKPGSRETSPSPGSDVVMRRSTPSPTPGPKQWQNGSRETSPLPVAGGMVRRSIQSPTAGPKPWRNCSRESSPSPVDGGMVRRSTPSPTAGAKTPTVSYGSRESSPVPKLGAMRSTTPSPTQVKETAGFKTPKVQPNEFSQQNGHKTPPASPLRNQTPTETESQTLTSPVVSPLRCPPSPRLLEPSTSPEEKPTPGPEKTITSPRSPGVKPPTPVKPKLLKPPVKPKPLTQKPSPLIKSPTAVNAATKANDADLPHTGVKSKQISARIAADRAAFFAGVSQPKSPPPVSAESKVMAADVASPVPTEDLAAEEIAKVEEELVKSLAKAGPAKNVNANNSVPKDETTSNEVPTPEPKEIESPESEAAIPAVAEESPDVVAEANAEVDGHEKISPNPEVREEEERPEDDKEEDTSMLTADSLESANPSTPKSDIRVSLQRLRSSLRSSSPDSNGIKSPTLSPASTLERNRTHRYSTSSLERRRRNHGSSSTTSRDDFKALLLQSFSKTSSGNQMTATEKLQRQRINSTPPGGADVSDSIKDSRSQILSMSNLKAAMASGRQGRRANRHSPDARKSFAGLTSYGKRHPPVTMNKYTIRSRTPTRPMMSISEDNENERSPEKPDEDQITEVEDPSEGTSI